MEQECTMIDEKRKLMGARIVYYRNLRNYTQQELSALIGVTRQYLSKLEHGKCSCSMETMYRIAEVLRIDPAELVADNWRNGK
jgi:transcriptional regulator with XRE-family HTH domain